MNTSGDNIFEHRRRPLRGLISLCVILTLLTPLAPPPPVLAQDSTSIMFENAYALFKKRKFESAIVIFRRIFKLDPNPFVLFNIGRCYEELGQLETAVQYYDRSLKIDGLPQKARVDAIKRIERLTPRLKQRKTFRSALREASVLVDRSFYVAQNDAKNKAYLKGDDTTFEVKPVEESALGHWTWIGGGTIAVGIIALGVGGVIDGNIGDKLSQQEDLIKSYQALGDQALIENDPDKAQRAISDAIKVNNLADEIESDQTLAGALVGTGTVFILGGITMILLDTPLFDETTDNEDASNTFKLIPTHNGVGVSTSW